MSSTRSYRHSETGVIATCAFDPGTGWDPVLSEAAGDEPTSDEVSGAPDAAQLADVLGPAQPESAHSGASKVAGTKKTLKPAKKA